MEELGVDFFYHFLLEMAVSSVNFEKYRTSASLGTYIRYIRKAPTLVQKTCETFHISLSDKCSLILVLTIQHCNYGVCSECFL